MHRTLKDLDVQLPVLKVLGQFTLLQVDSEKL